MSPSPQDPTLPVDDDARALAKALLRTARAGTLATLDANGSPFASLVALSTTIDGTPIILTSSLSAHTQYLAANPICSVLVAAIGKGDPLAHPRLTVLATARPLARDAAETAETRRRYLAHQPKAALYVDFPDFGFWRLDVTQASLNGGFGRAYRMSAADLLTPVDDVEAFTVMEASAIAHMNADHADAVSLYATRLCGAEPGPWIMTAIDPEGAQLACGDTVVRLVFGRALASPDEVRPALIALARKARDGNS
ncbi:HugZ family protein [Microvirga antarctica]|uniref:HugZ family pyridoxamine 5'-phosphate oxidase n=1 Tax=Microvirga antarctica TaxID=2819233 RepID=UPI001B312D9C|nr:DUF2470 domain-containing protein [Microvirga antarctica]